MSDAGLLHPDTRFRQFESPLRLESGAELPGVTVAYRSWGRLNAAGDNAVLVCHALTGSADVDQWWPGLLGPGRALDPERDFIVCSNVLGGCYGSTGPASLSPATGQRYGAAFPPLTVRDLVAAQARLLETLGVRTLALVVGGSLGGMQALEWAALFPKRVRAVAAVSVSARQSAWCIGLSEAQRHALYADPRWRDGGYDPADPPAAGLAAARMVAMCSYRHWGEFAARFGRESGPGGFQVESYLRHQGRKFTQRFDAASYAALTRIMDSHDLGRDRGGVEAALASLDLPVLVVGSTSDLLYTPEEQRELARHLPAAELAWLDSAHGHDAFLIDTGALDALLRDFRARQAKAHHLERRRYSCQA
ncbi:MAG: homoserine O-acetyltransferase MetX [Bacillota bacterium]